MSYGAISASMTFTFNREGRLIKQRAYHYNDAKERNVWWVNREQEDAVFEGIRVPVVGEALWEFESGDFTYIRWRITNVETNRPTRY